MSARVGTAPDEDGPHSFTVGPTPTDLPADWIDMPTGYRRWLLWVCNDGPDPINVQFSCAPNKTHPDVEATSLVVCPPGRSVSSYGDGLHRNWTVAAWSTTANECSGCWGVTYSTSA